MDKTLKDKLFKLGVIKIEEKNSLRYYIYFDKKISSLELNKICVDIKEELKNIYKLYFLEKKENNLAVLELN